MGLLTRVRYRLVCDARGLEEKPCGRYSEETGNLLRLVRQLESTGWRVTEGDRPDDMRVLCPIHKSQAGDMRRRPMTLEVRALANASLDTLRQRYAELYGPDDFLVRLVSTGLPAHRRQLIAGILVKELHQEDLVRLWRQVHPDYREDEPSVAPSQRGAHMLTAQILDAELPETMPA